LDPGRAGQPPAVARRAGRDPPRTRRRDPGGL